MGAFEGGDAHTRWWWLDVVPRIRTTLMYHEFRLTIPLQTGTTPLHCAAFHGRLEAVETLIRHGADVATETSVRFAAVARQERRV